MVFSKMTQSGVGPHWLKMGHIGSNPSSVDCNLYFKVVVGMGYLRIPV